MAFPWLWRQVESCISSCLIPSSSGTAKSLSVPSSNPVCGFCFLFALRLLFQGFLFFFFLMHGNSFAQLAACPSILLQKELSKCFILQTWNILEFNLPMLACGLFWRKKFYGDFPNLKNTELWMDFYFFFNQNKWKEGEGTQRSCLCLWAAVLQASVGTGVFSWSGDGWRCAPRTC